MLTLWAVGGGRDVREGREDREVTTGPVVVCITFGEYCECDEDGGYRGEPIDDTARRELVVQRI